MSTKTENILRLIKLKEFHWNGVDFLKFKRPYLGALIVHLGFLMAVLGFTGNYQTNSAEVNLNLGQSTQFYGYNIKNNGLKDSEIKTRALGN